MNRDPGISNELKAIAPFLHACSRDMPFQVPTGYWDSLSSTLQERLRAEGLVPDVRVSLPTHKPELGFEVPDGYFHQLPEQILMRIRNLGQGDPAPAGDPQSPMLESLRGVPSFELPEGYFEGLETHLLKKIRKPERPGLVVAMSVSTRFRRLAVAAATVGVILVSTLIFLRRADPGIPVTVATTDTLPVGTGTTKDLSEAGLSDFLLQLPEQILDPVTDDTASLPELAGSLFDIDDVTIAAMLEKIPDDAVASYLQDDPQHKTPDTHLF